MLPANLLNSLKAYAQAQAQKTLPSAAPDAAPKAAQFETGQKVQGSVQAQVAPGTFKVQVGGHLIQMQLPSSIRSGDTVALQVVSTQPRLVFSMVNSANPLSTPEQLGSVARLLSSLSQQTPEKAYVRATQSRPLWETPQPPSSKELAGKLQEALSNSGLFYESHQAQWLEGARTTEQLLHEPQNLPPEQAKLAAPPTTGNRPGEPAKTGQPNQPAEHAAAPQPGNTGKPATPHQQPTGGSAANADGANTGTPAATAGTTPLAASTTSAQAESISPGIPEHLQPLVQQQLNALETRQMMWQGTVWPGQEMRWEIQEQTPRTPEDETQRQWVTQLQLDLPNLGQVTATLRFNSAGLSVSLDAASADTRALMGKASARLTAALTDAGIPLVGAQVVQGTTE